MDSCCFKSKFYRKDLIDELKIFGMSSRHHIDDFMRGRIIGKIEEGRKTTDVARELDIAHSVVSRLWKSFKTTGMCSRRHEGGRVRSTTPAEDRYIVLSAKRNRSTTAQQVANQFLAASGKQISRKTVARRLRGGGLYARRPVVCVPLTRQHRTARLQWCREHHNWTEQDCACVLFSDESRFSLSSDCKRQLIWRESGTAYRPENIQEKDRYPTCSIMVWAGIIINGRTRLHVVANGTMTGQRYIDEVLHPHVRLFRGAVGDKFVFMDDNATCHRTLAVQDCLDSEGIQRLVWPARSPDLNPIENVWDALGRKYEDEIDHQDNHGSPVYCFRTHAVEAAIDIGHRYILREGHGTHHGREAKKAKHPQSPFVHFDSNILLRHITIDVLCGRFLLGVWTVNSPPSHIVRVYDAGHGKSGVFHSAEWHDGDCSSDGIREADNDEVEKLAYQLNKEAERTERPIRRLRTAIRGFSSGRPRGATPADDRYIVLQARRNRRQTAGEIARHTTQATGRPISRFTVARRMHGGGLFARRPVRCVPLTPAHRRRRSLWCREHRNWGDNEWGRVLFTDESRFSFSSDSHCILICRERGSRNHPSNIIERDRGAMGLQFLFMDDNAPCHRTVAAEQLLESEDIERMDWPARSPDLNTIEHVWDFLGRRLAARTLPPVTIRELRLALQDEWAAMPQQLIDTLILSMCRRCETCLAVRGDHIPY
ncbi:transposable element Tcb2 transposase [Trichonephila clavipes]|nr:transposable element Tcb2 transposase [Trichonephila clavipes]